MSNNGWWTASRLQFTYFSGLALASEWNGRGAGVILRFDRVRPARRDRFQPLRAREVTPQFLDGLLRALTRWNCPVISIDEASARSARGGSPGRFVCLTFDGGSRDIATYAYPILARHGVPFTVYLPTAFPDGVGEAWWLALEQVIARSDRLALLIDHSERRFDTARHCDKVQVFHFLASWLRTMAPAALTAAIQDLCKRYSVNLAAVTREAVMDWDDIGRLAADPGVTIGSATVNYPVLANLSDVVARKEIAMGRAVLQAALGRDAPHLAYPFGDRGSFGPQHVASAKEQRFASAVTTLPGVIGRGALDPLALPRIAWDGRKHSLRGLRVILSGLMPGAARGIGRSG
ncbi:polysaccharide deacetylase family protein [Rhodopseudomonas palustris]|uniref:polysaccharide deacetylase family protein n=1 Tax=Rhodopseudomonas palustris TaxID=1076 RepID=UPI00115F0341|nr:polysaccharide deacetylase family protein [Rhodopseudomonas palustris]QDL97457.1 polysaccharide deacetylase family protein [Rhodopseudomonas palustris]